MPTRKNALSLLAKARAQIAAHANSIHVRGRSM